MKTFPPKVSIKYWKNSQICFWFAPKVCYLNHSLEYIYLSAAKYIILSSNFYQLENTGTDMKSYLWQWLALFLISSYYGHSYGKPILSTLVRKMGRGVQKAVGSLRKITTPVSKWYSTWEKVNIKHQSFALITNKVRFQWHWYNNTQLYFMC